MIQNQDNAVEAQERIRDLLKSAEQDRINKRVSHGIAELCKGRTELLKNDELLRHLPDQFMRMAEEEDAANLFSFFETLRNAALSEDLRLRERALTMMSISADHLLENGSPGQNAYFSETMISWLREEDRHLAGYEIVCGQLAAICQLLMRNGQWGAAAEIVSVLDMISNEKNLKPNALRSIAIRNLQAIGNLEVLEKVYAEILAGNCDFQKELETVVLGLGEDSMRYALNLLDQEATEHLRGKLIDLLVKGKEDAVAIIQERIRSGNIAWHLARDMVEVLGTMDRQELYPTMERFLSHADQRVQQEVIRAIMKMAGKELLPRLLSCMEVVGESLKVNIIKKLSHFTDNRIEEAFRRSISKLNAENSWQQTELLSALVVGIGRYPHNKNLIVLKELLEVSGEASRCSTFRSLLEENISQLETEIRKSEHRRAASEKVQFHEDPVLAQQIREKTEKIEQEVKEYLQAGLVREAVDTLVYASISYAREKDFPTAEMLRDKILNTDPTAINRLLEVEELLIKERQSAMPGRFVDIWKGLQNTLGENHFCELYEHMAQESYSPGEVIAREGERNDSLYFLYSGSVSISCLAGQTDTFLKRIDSGAIIGAEPFFKVSVWTMTAKAAGEAILYVLNRTSLDHLEMLQPGFEGKIQDYCSGSNYVPELLKMSGADRRNSVRFPVGMNIDIRIFDKYGTEGQRSIISRLHDISQGGMCCCVRIGRQNHARQLLGRQVRAVIPLSDGEKFDLEGKVVGVERVAGGQDNYYLHVKTLDYLPYSIVELVKNMKKS